MNPSDKYTLAASLNIDPCEVPPSLKTFFRAIGRKGGTANSVAQRAKRAFAGSEELAVINVRRYSIRPCKGCVRIWDRVERKSVGEYPRLGEARDAAQKLNSELDGTDKTA